MEDCLDRHKYVVFYRVIFRTQSVHLITKSDSIDVIVCLQFLNNPYFIQTETEVLM